MSLKRSEYSKRWRENHPDNYQKIHKKYYDKNPAKLHARVIKFRLFKSGCKRLMNILID